LSSSIGFWCLHNMWWNGTWIRCLETMWRYIQLICRFYSCADAYSIAPPWLRVMFPCNLPIWRLLIMAWFHQFFLFKGLSHCLSQAYIATEQTVVSWGLEVARFQLTMLKFITSR
jgi:hypothetical protein